MALKPLHNEAELLRLLSAGDEKAFNQIFYATHQQLGAFVFSVVKSREAAEEIVQDVFLKLWANRVEVSGLSNFTAYLFILTRNQTLNAIRKIANDQRRQSDYEKAFTDVPEEPASLSGDYEILLERAVSQLPPQQQKVFLLRQQGYKNSEVAEQMHISPGSAKKYQQWAIQSIARFIKVKAALSILFFFLN